jgi:hypothetical protein
MTSPYRESPPALPAFKSRDCGKCGERASSGLIASRWCVSSVGRRLERCDAEGEHMHRECLCGFEWLELPKDAARQKGKS